MWGPVKNLGGLALTWASKKVHIRDGEKSTVFKKRKFTALFHFISSEQVISIKDEMLLVSQTLFFADHYERDGCRRPAVLTQEPVVKSKLRNH